MDQQYRTEAITFNTEERPSFCKGRCIIEKISIFMFFNCHFLFLEMRIIVFILPLITTAASIVTLHSDESTGIFQLK